MSDDRDTAQTRENIARVGRAYHDLARKAGNTNITVEDATRRVAEARRRGDRKRDNGNR